jgi:hypothetical protein
MTQFFMQQPAYQDNDYIEEYEDDALYQRGTGYIEQYQNSNIAQYPTQQTVYQSSNGYSVQSPPRPIHPGRTQNSGYGQQKRKHS